MNKQKKNVKVWEAVRPIVLKKREPFTIEDVVQDLLREGVTHIAPRQIYHTLRHQARTGGPVRVDPEGTYRSEPWNAAPAFTPEDAKLMQDIFSHILIPSLVPVTRGAFGRIDEVRALLDKVRAHVEAHELIEGE